MLKIILLLICLSLINMPLEYSLHENVTARINSSMKKLYYINATSGLSVPNVCVLCDQFTGRKGENITPYLLKRNKELFYPPVSINEKLKNSYVYADCGKSDWMNECMFSPRTVYELEKKKFVICKECNRSVKRGIKPLKCIANGWFFWECSGCVN
jgi:hypothetical protein